MNFAANCQKHSNNPMTDWEFYSNAFMLHQELRVCKAAAVISPPWAQTRFKDRHLASELSTLRYHTGFEWERITEVSGLATISDQLDRDPTEYQRAFFSPLAATTQAAASVSVALQKFLTVLGVLPGIAFGLFVTFPTTEINSLVAEWSHKEYQEVALALNETNYKLLSVEYYLQMAAAIPLIAMLTFNTAVTLVSSTAGNKVNTFFGLSNDGGKEGWARQYTNWCDEDSLPSAQILADKLDTWNNKLEFEYFLENWLRRIGWAPAALVSNTVTSIAVVAQGVLTIPGIVPGAVFGGVVVWPLTQVNNWISDRSFEKFQTWSASNSEWNQWMMPEIIRRTMVAPALLVVLVANTALSIFSDRAGRSMAENFTEPYTCDLRDAVEGEGYFVPVVEHLIAHGLDGWADYLMNWEAQED